MKYWKWWFKTMFCFHDYHREYYDDEDYIPGIPNTYRKCTKCGLEKHR